MLFRAMAGLLAGLSGGIVSGIIFLVLTVPQVDGPIPILSLIARGVGSLDPSVGWSYHLFNSVIVGMLFGAIVGRYATSFLSGETLGLLTGLFWWGVGSLILMPQLGGTAGGVGFGVVRSLFVATLIASILHGLVMGAVYVWLYHPMLIEEYRQFHGNHPQGQDADLTTSGYPRR